MNARHRFLAGAALRCVLVLGFWGSISAVHAQSCPANFFDVLDGSADTTAAKQDVGDACRGRDVTLRAAVVDIAKRGDVFELHLASLASGNRITVTMRDIPGADLTQLRKGSVVVVSAKLRDFTGQQTQYIALDDGSCKACAP